MFTLLESSTIYGGDNINKASFSRRKGGVKTPSFLTGFTLNDYFHTLFLIKTQFTLLLNEFCPWTLLFFILK